MSRPSKKPAPPYRRAPLRLGWYDLTVAGLILVICVGALVRLAGSTPPVEAAYAAYTAVVSRRVFHRRPAAPSHSPAPASSPSAAPETAPTAR